MKNPGDENALSIRFIEDDVLALLKPADAGEDLIAGPAQTRRICQQLEAPCQLLNVVFGLLFAPGVDCVIEYLGKIGGAFWS
jgi:hypothetical protein